MHYIIPRLKVTQNKNGQRLGKENTKKNKCKSEELINMKDFKLSNKGNAQILANI